MASPRPYSGRSPIRDYGLGPSLASAPAGASRVSESLGIGRYRYAAARSAPARYQLECAPGTEPPEASCYGILKGVDDRESSDEGEHVGRESCVHDEELEIGSRA